MLRRILFIGFAVALLALLSTRLRGDAPRTAALGAFGRGPTVVLVHGLGSSAADWLPVARDLARDHRVVLVELPGHGLAEMPGALTLDGATVSLDRAIAEQCEGPVVLVGHSVGGLVATSEALRAPDRVRALVLVETALRPQFDAAERRELLDSLERDYTGTVRACWSDFGRDSAQGARLVAEAERVDPPAMKAWIRLALTADLSPGVGELRAPVLAVLSDRSWPDGEAWTACADTLGYSGIRSLRPARLEGTGHFVMLDRPHALAALVRGFERATDPGFLAAFVR
jgi:pimeloyl-ACP methyl ester carboxylesterase